MFLEGAERQNIGHFSGNVLWPLLGMPVCDNYLISSWCLDFRCPGHSVHCPVTVPRLCYRGDLG